MIRLKKNYIIAISAVAILAIAAILAYFLIPRNLSIVDPDVPLSDGGIYITKAKQDYTDSIQKAFDEGAKSGQTVYFALDDSGNPQHFSISGTLFIPNGLRVEGNGATITVDGTTPFTKAAGASSVFSEFCIMSQSLVNKEVASFSISNLNFEIANDNADSKIPQTLMGIGIVDGVNFDNCSFTVNTSIDRAYGSFDLYARWRNVTLTGCTFNTMHDAPYGGVWIRNLSGWDNGEVAENLKIESCTFNKRAGDEILGIYGNSKVGIRNVTVSNSTFNQYASTKNNSAHLIRLGQNGTLDNVVFDNNTITSDGFYSTLIRVGEEGNSNSNINITNNNITVTQMTSSTNLAMITVSNNTSGISIAGNVITGYAGTDSNGKAIKRMAVSGTSVVLFDNKFYGNGFSTISSGVPHVENNYIEQTEIGFLDAASCFGNIIDDCTSYAVAIRGTANPSVKNSEVTISSNLFTSLSGNGSIFTGTGTLNTTIRVENNVFNCLSITLNNTTCGSYYYGNVFNMTSLDNFKMNGAAQEFNDNIIYKMDISSLSKAPDNSELSVMSAASFITTNSKASRFISPSAPPQPYGINYAIPVGGIVYVTQGTYSSAEDAINAIKDAAAKDPTLVVAFEKIQDGRTADTWKALTAADFGWSLEEKTEDLADLDNLEDDALNPDDSAEEDLEPNEEDQDLISDSLTPEISGSNNRDINLPEETTAIS